MNIPIKTIYVDLDGVLVDFDEGFKRISNGVSKQDYIKHHGMDSFWLLINTFGFEWWEQLPWLSDGKTLYEELKTFNTDIIILSSGTFRNTGSLAKTGKEKWVYNNIGNIKTIIVPSSSLKKNYSTSDSILIDDLYSNIVEWNYAGGTAIHHKNAANTIAQLHAIVGK